MCTYTHCIYLRNVFNLHMRRLFLLCDHFCPGSVFRKETSNVEKDEAVMFFSVPSYNYYKAATAVNMATLPLTAGVLQNGLPSMRGNRPWKHPEASSASTGQWAEHGRAQQALSSARTQDAGSSRPKVAMSSWKRCDSNYDCPVG